MIVGTGWTGAILAMPGFGWRLSDDETAQLASFVRNNWGNHAPAASAREVARVRADLKQNGADKADTH